jgi:hypothetical protein
LIQAPQMAPAGGEREIAADPCRLGEVVRGRGSNRRVRRCWRCPRVVGSTWMCGGIVADVDHEVGLRFDPPIIDTEVRRPSGTRYSTPIRGSPDTGWDRWYQWYCRQYCWFLVVLMGGTGGTTMKDHRSAWTALDIGTTCQYHLFAPIPVEYHRSHPSPRKRLAGGTKLRIMTAPWAGGRPRRLCFEVNAVLANKGGAKPVFVIALFPPMSVGRSMPAMADLGSFRH